MINFDKLPAYMKTPQVEEYYKLLRKKEQPLP